jgi:hypothetical protein
MCIEFKNSELYCLLIDLTPCFILFIGISNLPEGNGLFVAGISSLVIGLLIAMLAVTFIIYFRKYWVSEWLSDYYLTPTKHLFSYIMARTS